MKIILSFEEVKRFKETIDSVEVGLSEQVINSLKKNKIITCNVDIFNQRVTIIVNEGYMVEFLDAYNRLIMIFSIKVKSFMKTVETFQEETQGIIQKYNKGGDKNA